MDLLCN